MLKENVKVEFVAFNKFKMHVCMNMILPPFHIFGHMPWAKCHSGHVTKNMIEEVINNTCNLYSKITIDRAVTACSDVDELPL